MLEDQTDGNSRGVDHAIASSAPAAQLGTALLIPQGVNNKPRLLGGDRFHKLFSDNLQNDKTRGELIALEIGKDKISFSELEARSNQIAHHLLANGAAPGETIALLFDRTLNAYASLLAVSKIGCTFVPLDASFPQNRIAFICEDSGAKFALTISSFADKFKTCNVLPLVLDQVELESYPNTEPKLAVQLDDDPISYVIYTSGTTGNPKGVPIRHSAICNFLRVAAEGYGFRPDDRVFQSLTLAFDYSFEEIWVPLLCGSCLVPAPTGISLLGDDLWQFLSDQKITAWCSVPTVLATLENDLPNLRLLLVSGEACPADLVSRWATKKRRFLNVYGPTEATVSATWKVMQPGQKVTIGEPLATYSAMILSPSIDEILQIGEEGELALAGIGLAPGYLNRKTETQKAFIDDFLELENNPSGMIYRTGDLARINADGEIEYLGRVDTQVKIRGYRIELEEIETVAREITGLSSLIVNPVKSKSGDTELAAYYVPENPDDLPDTIEFQTNLAKRMPAYMVPAYFEPLEALPLLPSQKVDRKNLPAPTAKRAIKSTAKFVAAKTGLQKRLSEVLCDVLDIELISADADFFNDLGINSLMLARFLGGVRKKLNINSLTMRHVYQNTNLQSLAKVITELDKDVASRENFAAAAPMSPEELIFKTANLDDTIAQGIPHSDVQNIQSNSNENPSPAVSSLQYISFATAQVGWMLMMGFIGSYVFIDILKWWLKAESAADIYLRSMGSGLSLFFVTSVLLIAVKWIAIGRFKPGKINLYGVAHFRFWVAETAVRANPLNLFLGTPAFNIYLRLVGAKIGKGVLLFSPAPSCPDLITIGDDVLIRQDCLFSGHHASDGALYLGTIEIGDRTHIAEATVLSINCSIGDDAQLGHRSSLHENQKVAGGSTYVGCPAAPSDSNFIRVPQMEVSPWRAWIYTLTGFLLPALITGPLSLSIFYYVATYAMGAGYLTLSGAEALLSIGNILAWTTVTYFVGIVFAMGRNVIMPRLYNLFFIPDVAHKLFGFQYFLAVRITNSSQSQMLQMLFGDSNLIVPYFKAIGYDLKELMQNGSNFGVEQKHQSPFLCKFSRNSFVSDGLALLNMDMSRTSFKMSQISVPDNTYLGNELHYPTGAKIGTDCLVATKAQIPIDGDIRTNVGILGSPPFEIPRPAPSYDPYQEPKLFERRLAMKFRSNMITLALFMARNIILGCLAALATWGLYIQFRDVIFSSTLHAALILAVVPFVMTVITVLYFIVWGRAANWYRPMKPRICSLYEPEFWDHERFWKLSDNRLIESFAGTPLKNIFIRLQGVKLGKQVFDNGAAYPEPFLVEIGDYACLNQRSITQSHSLEDGSFKCDQITFGNRCTFGTGAFVHYGVEAGDNVDIKTDAFVMKGTALGSNEIWSGNPSNPITRDQLFS